jgi:hypothetical protein
VGLAELLLRRHAAVRHRRCLAFLSLSFRFSFRFLSLRRRKGRGSGLGLIYGC